MDDSSIRKIKTLKGKAAFASFSFSGTIKILIGKTAFYSFSFSGLISSFFLKFQNYK